MTELGNKEALLAGRFHLEANAGATTLGGILAGDYVSKPRLFLLEWTLDGEKKPCRNHYLLGRAPYSLATYRQWLHELSLFSE